MRLPGHRHPAHPVRLSLSKPLLSLVMAVLLGSSGCTCVEDPKGVFACTRSDQCIDGHVCRDQRCQPADTQRCPTVSCELEACDGLACGGGHFCQRTVCACVEAGGAPETTERSCADGHDNDCDGLFDCTDFDCRCDGGSSELDASVPPLDGGLDAGAADAAVFDAGALDAGAHDAGLQDAGSPDAGAPDAGADAGSLDAGVPETNCSDGLDNDGDGHADCDDGDCEARTCFGFGGAKVCCSQACVSPTSDTMNCGGCGLRCAAGQVCTSVAIGGGELTGTCSCSIQGVCPMNQTCSAGSCKCDSSATCSAGGRCDNGYCSAR